MRFFFLFCLFLLIITGCNSINCTTLKEELTVDTMLGARTKYIIRTGANLVDNPILESELSFKSCGIKAGFWTCWAPSLGEDAWYEWDFLFKVDPEYLLNEEFGLSLKPLKATLGVNRYVFPGPSVHPITHTFASLEGDFFLHPEIYAANFSGLEAGKLFEISVKENIPSTPLLLRVALAVNEHNGWDKFGWSHWKVSAILPLELGKGFTMCLEAHRQFKLSDIVSNELWGGVSFGFSF